ncbi:MAG: 3-phosphoshikimate 1-carboxyvinyltransferase [Candidatus Nanopelagicales bacterium]
MSDAWPSPRATRPIDATVRVPGSKSLTARLLVVASLGEGPARLRRPLRARDTELMAESLRRLGATVEDIDGTDWSLFPGELDADTSVDCGLAGTVMRFVPPVAALTNHAVRFDGDPRARERPIAALLDALHDLGIDVGDDGRGALPFVVRGKGRVRGGPVSVDASASSQFLSGLLLAGCRYDDGIDVRAVGSVPSLPHVDMTVAVLRNAGVEVDDSLPGRWRVSPGVPSVDDVTVEPDLSNAAAFLAAAAATGGRVRIPEWPEATSQPGDQLRAILPAMGCEVSLAADGLTVQGPTTLRAVDLDLSAAGELTPVIAALCALAESTSTLRGIAHLRGHETDRLRALRTELTSLGGDVTETEDGLVIRPRPLHGGTMHSYADHRMAQAAAVLGLLVDGIQIDDVATTSKTLPGFVGMWTRMLG